MTYAERIKAIKRAIVDVDIDANVHLTDKMARAADAACIKALEEPAPDMLVDVPVGVLSINETFDETARRVWRAMWSKIDRGDQT